MERSKVMETFDGDSTTLDYWRAVAGKPFKAGAISKYLFLGQIARF